MDQSIGLHGMERGRAVEIQVLDTTQEAHAGDQPDQAEIMVSVQVGDKNMVDPAAPDLILVHLRLGAFPAIYQEKMVVKGNHLGRRMPVESRNG